MSLPQTLDACCLYAAQLPIELRVIIKKYFSVTLNDKRIRKTIYLWTNTLACRSLAILKYGHISYWDTSSITYMRGLFKGKKHFNEP